MTGATQSNTNVLAFPKAADAPRGKRKRKTKRSQGSVYERNGRWYMKFRVTDPATGIQSRPSESIEGATDRATALIALDKRLASIADGSYFARRAALPPLMFDEVADELLAWSRVEKRAPDVYKLAISDARRVFGGKPLSAMTVASLEAFRTQLVERIVAGRVERRKAEVSEEQREAFVRSARATTNRRMTVLRRMFNRLVEHERLAVADNPFARGKLKPYSVEENNRTRYYSPEEIARILAACTEPFRSYVGLALNTGLRRAELVRLTWDDWERAANTIRVRLAKGGKPRSVPLNSTAVVILQRLERRAKGSSIFHHSDGTPRTVSWAASAWNRACRRAGLVDAHLHDARHSFASHLVNKGVPIRVVQDLLGHSSIRLTERYSHLAQGAAHEAVELLAPVTGSNTLGGLHVGLQSDDAEEAAEVGTANSPKAQGDRSRRDRGRTCDMRRVRAPLCQLSYPPGELAIQSETSGRFTSDECRRRSVRYGRVNIQPPFAVERVSMRVC